MLQHLDGVRVVVGVLPDVFHMHRASVDEGAADDEPPVRRPREEALIRRGLGWRHVADRHQVEQFAVEPYHGAELGVADPGRVGDDGLEDGLGVGGAALFGFVFEKLVTSAPPAFYFAWQILVRPYHAVTPGIPTAPR